VDAQQTLNIGVLLVAEAEALAEEPSSPPEVPEAESDLPIETPVYQAEELGGSGESDDTDAYGSARYSGSNADDQWWGSEGEWDSSIYLASSSDFDFSRGRLRAENPLGYGKELKEIAIIYRESGDISSELQFALDDMRSQVESAADKNFADEMTAMTLLRVAAASLSAGFLAWLLRIGPMVAGMVATLPAWSRFDPLPVLLKNKKDEEEIDVAESKSTDTEDDSEDAVEQLFNGRDT